MLCAADVQSRASDSAGRRYDEHLRNSEPVAVCSFGVMMGNCRVLEDASSLLDLVGIGVWIWFVVWWLWLHGTEDAQSHPFMGVQCCLLHRMEIHSWRVPISR
jgi:hypothetical protein